MYKLMLVFAIVVLSGCAGRPGNPVALSQPDDNARNCPALQREIDLTRTDLAKLEPEAAAIAQNNTDIKTNMMSYIFVWFWFGLDTQEGQKQEVKAYKARLAKIEVLSAQNGCTANANVKL